MRLTFLTLALLFGACHSSGALPPSVPIPAAGMAHNKLAQKPPCCNGVHASLEFQNFTGDTLTPDMSRDSCWGTDVYPHLLPTGAYQGVNVFPLCDNPSTAWSLKYTAPDNSECVVAVNFRSRTTPNPYVYFTYTEENHGLQCGTAKTNKYWETVPMTKVNSN
jgi:hypothetical protein